MAVQISIRSVNFNEFTFHYLIYKNVATIAFEELFDGVAELLYEHQISIISNTILGDQFTLKQFKKAEAQAFDEPNWPTNQWLVSDDSSNISGMFWGVSGLTLKTLASDNFTTKIFETPKTRYCLIGDLAIKNTDEVINQAMLFAGLSANNVIKTWSTINMPFENKKTLNIEGLFIQNSIWSIRTENESVTTINIADNEFSGKSQLLTTLNYQALTLQLITGKGVTSEQLLTAIDQLIQAKGYSWAQLQQSFVCFSDNGQQKEFKNHCKTLKIPMAPLLMSVSTNQPEGTTKLILEFYLPI